MVQNAFRNRSLPFAVRLERVYGVVVAGMELSAFKAEANCLVAFEVNGKKIYQVKTSRRCSCAAVTYIIGDELCVSNPKLRRGRPTEEVDWQYVKERLPPSLLQRFFVQAPPVSAAEIILLCVRWYCDTPQLPRYGGDDAANAACMPTTQRYTAGSSATLRNWRSGSALPIVVLSLDLRQGGWQVEI